MNPETADFARKINRQRTSPTLFLFSYLTIRSNLATFHEFAAMVPANALLLDAGCGFRPWQKFFPSGVRYLGVDYSSEWSNADALATVDHLPFPDSFFDSIICSEVLEHTRHPEACIRELRRVCKPGGLLYISTPFAFPEHGVPYDFQRLTQYFYRDVFKADEIVCLRQTSSILGTAFTAFNFFVECTPLNKIWGLKHLVYFTCNLAGLICDTVIDFIAPRLLKDSRLYTHPLPLGLNMIIRVKKG